MYSVFPSLFFMYSVSSDASHIFLTVPTNYIDLSANIDLLTSGEDVLNRSIMYDINVGIRHDEIVLYFETHLLITSLKTQGATLGPVTVCTNPF